VNVATLFNEKRWDVIKRNIVEVVGNCSDITCKAAVDKVCAVHQVLSFYDFKRFDISTVESAQ